MKFNSLSTRICILDVTHYLYNNLENSFKCVGVLVDLAKAIDTINYSFLVHKLQFYAIK